MGDDFFIMNNATRVMVNEIESALARMNKGTTIKILDQAVTSWGDGSYEVGSVDGGNCTSRAGAAAEILFLYLSEKRNESQR